MGSERARRRRLREMPQRLAATVQHTSITGPWHVLRKDGVDQYFHRCMDSDGRMCPYFCWATEFMCLLSHRKEPIDTDIDNSRGCPFTYFRTRERQHRDITNLAEYCPLLKVWVQAFDYGPEEVTDGE